MLVLAIESTCDETGCAIVENGRRVLSNIVSSQVEAHLKFGGVVPELASRHHIDRIIPVIQEALDEAKVSLEAIDLIAVANGPGLMGALLIGLNTAKALSFALNKPLIGVNHVEAHLYAALMSHEAPISFPALGVVISGGHTALLYMNEVGNYSLIGQTIDDAIGETFDKVAKILGLPYPGGPEIEKLAKEGNKNAYSFKGGVVKSNPFAFSFSGLKTSVLYACKGQSSKITSPLLIKESEKCHVAASFQSAAFEDVIQKIIKAAELYSCKNIIFGGGVANNKFLKNLFEERKPSSLQAFFPLPSLTLDNAAMIGGIGYHYALKGRQDDPLTLEAATRMPFSNI